MSLVALDGTPLVMVGAPNREGVPSLAALSTLATLDTANEAAIWVGYIFTEDGGSHTIDTTGSSALEWRTGASTFANAGTTVVVGLAAVDTANGPPSRAANTTGTITFDVSKSHTGGGGGVTTNAWQTNVPGAGTKTVANGDLVAFAVQMTARGGADSVIVQGQVSLSGAIGLPAAVVFDGTSTYTRGTRLPDVVITFSDGKLGFFYGGYVGTSTTTLTWNSGSATKEYGNYFLMPVPAKIYGLYFFGAIGGDTDVVLYSDPLGTPVAEKTVSLDANTVSAATNSGFQVLFPAPYTTTASQPIAGILKPGGTNISFDHKTFNASAHQKSETLGANCYAVNRASGAFAAQNSNKDRFCIGLLVGAWDDGSGGSSGGISRARAFSGFA